MVSPIPFRTVSTFNQPGDGYALLAFSVIAVASQVGVAVFALGADGFEDELLVGVGVGFGRWTGTHSARWLGNGFLVEVAALGAFPPSPIYSFESTGI